ncbi:MAG: hypothetical protein U0031_02715 [Thermomicrobiales bacterium]
MVGHDHEGVQIGAREMVRDRLPAGQDDFADCRQVNTDIVDISEETGAVLSTNGDEVRPGLSVVVSPQANRPAMMVTGL